MINYINLFHIIFVAPLLFYIGYQHNYGAVKPSRAIYNFLIIIAFIVFAYHSYRLWIQL